MNDRVWIGTCAGPRDIMVVRSLFDAHDIPVVISGEHLFLLFPWYMGVFRTDIFASSRDAEDAAALLFESRRGLHAAVDEPGLSNSPASPPASPPIENRDHAAEAPWIGPPHPWSVSPADRWYQAGIALLFGMITGFGAAHFYYTRARWRGLALALVQLSATRIFGHTMTALYLLIVVRFVDVVGALWLFWYGRGDPTDGDEHAGTPPAPSPSSAGTHA